MAPVCTLCQKSFKGKYELKRHSDQHDPNKEAKKTACSFEGCKYRTLQPSNLKQHMKSMHSNKKPQRCAVEDYKEAYATDAGLIHHEKRKAHKSKPSETSPKKGKKAVFVYGSFKQPDAAQTSTYSTPSLTWSRSSSGPPSTSPTSSESLMPSKLYPPREITPSPSPRSSESSASTYSPSLTWSRTSYVSGSSLPSFQGFLPQSQTEFIPGRSSSVPPSASIPPFASAPQEHSQDVETFFDTNDPRELNSVPHDFPPHCFEDALQMQVQMAPHGQPFASKPQGHCQDVETFFDTNDPREPDVLYSEFDSAQQFWNSGPPVNPDFQASYVDYVLQMQMPMAPPSEQYYPSQFSPGTTLPSFVSAESAFAYDPGFDALYF